MYKDAILEMKRLSKLDMLGLRRTTCTSLYRQLVGPLR